MLSTSPAVNSWIQTRSGLRFDVLNPDPALIQIEDIAVSLSRQCRYTGHTSAFWSVAQHSVIVSQECDHEDALWGLLHDASEAYLIDIPRPLKRLPQFSFYRDLEDGVMQAVCDRFGLPYDMPASVKRLDTEILVTEAEQLMQPLHPDWHYRRENGYKGLDRTLYPIGPLLAERMFLRRFKAITERIQHGK